VSRNCDHDRWTRKRHAPLSRGNSAAEGQVVAECDAPYDAGTSLVLTAGGVLSCHSGVSRWGLDGLPAAMVRVRLGDLGTCLRRSQEGSGGSVSSSASRGRGSQGSGRTVTSGRPASPFSGCRHMTWMGSRRARAVYHSRNGSVSSRCTVKEWRRRVKSAGFRCSRVTGGGISTRSSGDMAVTAGAGRSGVSGSSPRARICFRFYRQSPTDGSKRGEWSACRERPPVGVPPTGCGSPRRPFRYSVQTPEHRGAAGRAALGVTPAIVGIRPTIPRARKRRSS